MQPPAQHRTRGLGWRGLQRPRGLEVLGVYARERSEWPTRQNSDESVCPSTHRLAVAPRHDEPVDRVLDSAEVGAALLTRHRSFTDPAPLGVAHGRVEDHPPPEAEVMWRSELRTVAFFVHRPEPPVTSMHRRASPDGAARRFPVPARFLDAAGPTGTEATKRSCQIPVRAPPKPGRRVGLWSLAAGGPNDAGWERNSWSARRG